MFPVLERFPEKVKPVNLSTRAGTIRNTVGSPFYPNFLVYRTVYRSKKYRKINEKHHFISNINIKYDRFMHIIVLLADFVKTALMVPFTVINAVFWLFCCVFL
jgi:hypothetical protein